MRAIALGLAAALASGAAPAADGLETLRAALARFTGSSPVSATLVRAVTSQRKDRPLEAGRVTLEVAAGPHGITVAHPPDLLEQLRDERAQTDPEEPRPARRTLRDFDAIDVSDMLNSATGLLSDLTGATLTAEAVAEYRGRPARLLELDLPVRLSKADRRWLKSASHGMKLWIAEDGVPLAAESEFDFVAGLLMFTFEARDFRVQEFVPVGDRLVAVRRTSTFDGEGLGESQHTQTETTLQLQPAR